MWHSRNAVEWLIWKEGREENINLRLMSFDSRLTTVTSDSDEIKLNCRKLDTIIERQNKRSTLYNSCLYYEKPHGSTSYPAMYFP